MAHSPTVTVKVCTNLSPVLLKGLRAVVGDVLTSHQRTGSDTCLCGAKLPWGSSFSTHVADEFEKQL